MEKRASERILSTQRVGITHFWHNMVFPGIMTNCSENGMYIRTGGLFLFDTKVEVIISWEKELLKVPVKVVRIVMKGNGYEGIGVKLLTLPKKYLELLIKLTFNSHSKPPSFRVDNVLTNDLPD